MVWFQRSCLCFWTLAHRVILDSRQSPFLHVLDLDFDFFYRIQSLGRIEFSQGACRKDN